MTINITSAFQALTAALGAFVQWLTTTEIQIGGVSASVFSIVVGVLVVDCVIYWFVPWSGGDDD